jgi:rfaE bifunctional protein kinase chain/domain
MLQFHKNRLEEIFVSGHQKKVIVVGDLMLDRYLWGNVTRISPEAPVPIINIEDEEIRFGGAGNVANNLIGLGALPVVVGVIGDDDWGKIFRSLLLKKNLIDKGLVVDSQRPTTMKTRIIGNSQHIARVDREKLLPIDQHIQTEIINFITEIISDVEAVILQDYNKGVVNANLIHKIIDLAARSGKTVTADPKFNNFWEFKGITVFKPNKKEAEEALAMKIQTEDDLKTAGNKIIERLDGEAVLITRGQEGMALFEKKSQPTFLMTRARKVADVSGAGDTVISTLTFALSAGCSMQEAVQLANYAAGLVCEEVGVVPVDGGKLVQAILKNQAQFENE